MTEAHATSERNSFTEPPQPALEVFLNLNESPFGMHVSVMQAAAGSLVDAGRYQFGLVGRLRWAIAAIHGVPEEWVSLYLGSNRALHYAMLAFTGAQAPLVVAAPGYPICEQTARLLQRLVHQVALMEKGEHHVDVMGEASHSVHVGRSWSEMPGWMPITVGNSEEMDALRNALVHPLGLTSTERQ